MPTSSSLKSVLVVSSLLVCGVAAAEDQRPAGTASKPRPRYVWTPGAAVPPGTQHASSQIVYMHRCDEVAGCFVIGGGTNNSRTDQSTIADGQRTLGGFKQGDEVWAATMACVRETFAPFNITITDVDPGDVPHFENLVGGKASDVSDSPDLANAGGVAPFACGEIPNAIVYTFDIYGPDAEHLCWTSAQEIAHAFGLEHQFLQKDPLTYLEGDLPKRFRDFAAPCGEYQQEDGCQCGGTSQNTYRRIVGMFGPGAPTPPAAAFKRISADKEVQPGFIAIIEAIDDVRVEKVELLIDGQSVGMATEPVGDDFRVPTPASLAQGAHTLEARATDVQGVVGTTTLNITVGEPCTAAAGCSGVDVCVSGVCIPGPEEPGGLGDQCQRDTECLTLQCADAGEAQRYCTAACSTNADCPSDFECITGGVCWPAPSGGCCDTGTASSRRGAPGALLLALGVGIVVVRRKRRR